MSMIQLAPAQVFPTPRPPQYRCTSQSGDGPVQFGLRSEQDQVTPVFGCVQGR